MLNILVTGVNGAGKTSVLGHIHQLKKPDWEVVHATAAVMQKLGIDEGDYKALHQVHYLDVEYAYRKLILEWVEDARSGIRLVDSHLLNLKGGCITKVGVPELAEMDGMVLLVAAPETILQRLFANQRDVERGIFALGDTEAEKRLTIAGYTVLFEQEFYSYVQQFNKPNVRVVNDSNPPGDAAEAVVRFVEHLYKYKYGE